MLSSFNWASHMQFFSLVLSEYMYWASLKITLILFCPDDSKIKHSLIKLLKNERFIQVTHEVVE